MVAQPAVSAPLRWTSRRPPVARLLQWVAASSAMLLLLVAAALLCRRLAGALRPSLTAAQLLAAGASLAIVAAALRLVGQASRDPVRPSRADLVCRWLPVGALFVFGLALSTPFRLARSTPSVSPWALTVFWIMLIAQEGAWRLVARRLGLRPRSERIGKAAGTGPKADREPSGLAAQSGDAIVPANVDFDIGAAEPIPPGVFQQITRARLDDGAEVLSGLLRGYFAPGQRSQSLHVAFCPPLEGAPDVQVQQLAGPQASLKTAEARSYGVRLDLRLPAPVPHPVSVLVRLHVHSAAANHGDC